MPWSSLPDLPAEPQTLRPCPVRPKQCPEIPEDLRVSACRCSKAFPPETHQLRRLVEMVCLTIKLSPQRILTPGQCGVWCCAGLWAQRLLRGLGFWLRGFFSRVKIGSLAGSSDRDAAFAEAGPMPCFLPWPQDLWNVCSHGLFTSTS